MKVQVSAPGKLFLAGEYAVVEAGYPALVAALDRYLTVTVENSDKGRVYSSQQGLTVFWDRSDEDVVPLEDDSYALIFSAMKAAEAYVRMLGQQTVVFYSLSVSSQLDDCQSGIKYGLGSSGAVTVATIKAVLLYYGLEVSAYRVFQLAAIAQLQVGMTGSFGDLAASSYGGLIAYHSLDRNWLAGLLDTCTLSEILAMPWKDVGIERLSLPTSLSLLIGWTGRAASTPSLVDQARQKGNQTDKEISHQEFLSNSKACLHRLIQACRQGDVASFKEGISENRKLLQVFSQEMEMVIETPALTNLCQLAEEEGAVAKSSGAGGGDCGIAFVSQEHDMKKIYQKWQEADIVPLELTIADEIR